MNTKRKITILSILIALILVVTTISITYAIWQTTKVADNTNVITSGCLNIEFKELTDSYNLERVDINEAQGNYVFTITNTCNTISDYEVNLETLEGTNIDKSKLLVMYYVMINKDFNPKTLEEYVDYLHSQKYDTEIDSIADSKYLNEFDDATPTLNNAIYANKIYSGVILPNYTHVIQIVSGIYSNTQNDIETMDKTWQTKIVVNNTTHKKTPIKVSLDSGDGILDTNEITLYQGEKYGKLPIPTKEGYEFIGWYIKSEDETYDSGGPKFVTNDTIITTKENHTLKASWSAKNEEAILSKKFLQKYDLTNIKRIIPYNGNPFADEIIHLRSVKQVQEHGNLIVAWVDNDTLYYYSPANTIKLKDNIQFYSDKNSALEEIDLSRIDTSEMTDMSYMFSNLTNLKSINLSNWNTTNVTNMSGMFDNCLSLSTLDLSSFDFTNVTNISNMLCHFNGEVIYNSDSLDPSIDNALKNKMCTYN